MPSPRDHIVASAFKLLEESGLEALTIRKVAEASNFGRSTVVHHFDDKAGLVDAVYVVALGTMLEYLDQPAAFSPLSPGADVMARIFPEGAGAAPPLMAILETFRQSHPEVWSLLRYHPCPSFDFQCLSEVAQRIARGLIGERDNHEAALELVAHTRLAFHEYVISLPAAEAFAVIGRAPGSEFLRLTFGD